MRELGFWFGGGQPVPYRARGTWLYIARVKRLLYRALAHAFTTCLETAESGFFPLLFSTCAQHEAGFFFAFFEFLFVNDYVGLAHKLHIVLSSGVDIP